jgi:hypothetical protein
MKLTREKMHEILDMVLDAYEMSSPDSKSIAGQGREPVIDFDFSGALGILYIYVYKRGWKSFVSPDRIFQVHVNKNLPDNWMEDLRDTIHGLIKG